jgi:hypothetical protein
MNLNEAVQAVADSYGPCLVMAVQIGREEEGSIGSGGAFASSATQTPTHQVVHGLAVLHYLYSAVCERYADSLGVPQNQLHGLITAHYNALKTNSRWQGARLNTRFIPVPVGSCASGAVR